MVSAAFLVTGMLVSRSACGVSQEPQEAKMFETHGEGLAREWRQPEPCGNRNHVLSFLHFSAAALLSSPLGDCEHKQAHLLGASESARHPLELREVPGGTQWGPCHALVPPCSCQHCQGWYRGVPEAVHNQVGRPSCFSPRELLWKKICLLTTLFA